MERARRERDARGRGEAREEGRGDPGAREDSTTESDEPGKHSNMCACTFSPQGARGDSVQVIQTQLRINDFPKQVCVNYVVWYFGHFARPYNQCFFFFSLLKTLH